MNGSLFSALWLEKMAIGITIGLIVMVAALNIVATLILMVMEKHKDIAILVSMGASRGSIRRIFVLQGTVIGAVGTFAGGTLGWALCRVLDAFKLIRVPVDVYQISYVPFKLLPRRRRGGDRGRRAHLLPGHPPSRDGRRPPRPRRSPPLRMTGPMGLAWRHGDHRDLGDHGAKTRRTMRFRRSLCFVSACSVPSVSSLAGSFAWLKR